MTQIPTDHPQVPPPLDPELRAAVLADLQARVDGTHDDSAHTLAKRHGIARSTIMKIAAEEGLDEPFDRTHTAAASRAKAIDNRARRAALAAAMLEDAEKLRQRVWEPAEVITATGARVEVDLPIAADVRQFVSAVTAYVKSSLEVDAKDAETEQHAAVDAWLRTLVGEGDGD